MITFYWIAGIAIVFAIGAVPISILFNLFRKKQKAPATISWASEIPIQYTDINGHRIRYIKTGSGPNLVLLHTLRTQLDLFQKIIPDLAKDFTVYAFDFPGHGWSDIPLEPYTPQFFVRSVEGFLTSMKIDRAVLVGESIGATVALMMSTDDDPRIRGIVAVNPFDYRRRFTMRSHLMTKFTFWIGAIPILGETFVRLRTRGAERQILEGGVARAESLPADFLREMYAVGARPGHYRGFVSIIRNSFMWQVHAVYPRVNVPVLLVYGDSDWSHVVDREATHKAIPGARITTVEDAGHFLSVDEPRAFVDNVRSLAGEPTMLSGASDNSTVASK